MSTGTAVLPGSIASVSPFLPGESEPESLDWLLTVLQDTIAEVQSSDGSALQKASAITRLGNLYLKARRTIALEQSVKALKQRIAELEQCLSAAEPRAAESDTQPAPPVPDSDPHAGPGESPGEPKPAAPRDVFLCLTSDHAPESAHLPKLTTAAGAFDDHSQSYPRGHP